MKNLTILDSSQVEQANCITHSGIFHADEIMSTILLCKILPKVNLCRVTNITENIPKNAIIYDIGGGSFDHHQRDFNNTRENGILFSSFGLLWRKYGMQLLSNIENAEAVFTLFDNSFVACIDAIDNAQIELISHHVPIMTVSSVISCFNPNWDEETKRDDCFFKAVNFAEVIFDNVLKSTISKAKAKVLVERAIENSSNGILVLDVFMPWKQYVAESTNDKADRLLYVIFPSIRGGYNVCSIPNALGSSKQKKLFPKDWAGLEGREFAKISGIPTATFCHQARFLCGAETFDGALSLAQKAVAF